MSHVRITDDGDETCWVLVDDKKVAMVNHEDFGWSGMTQVIELVETLGRECGFEVSIEQDIV